eukprot:3200023-Rhodomonas_salina.1
MWSELIGRACRATRGIGCAGPVWTPWLRAPGRTDCLQSRARTAEPRLRWMRRQPPRQAACKKMTK